MELIRETDGPTAEEIQAACEILFRSEPMNGEAFRVVMIRHAQACRDAAKGFLRSARAYREMDMPDETARLVRSARWHWRKYCQHMETIR